MRFRPLAANAAPVLTSRLWNTSQIPLREFPCPRALTAASLPKTKPTSDTDLPTESFFASCLAASPLLSTVCQPTLLPPLRTCDTLNCALGLAAVKPTMGYVHAKLFYRTFSLFATPLRCMPCAGESARAAAARANAARRAARTQTAPAHRRRSRRRRRARFRSHRRPEMV